MEMASSNIYKSSIVFVNKRLTSFNELAAMDHGLFVATTIFTNMSN